VAGLLRNEWQVSPEPVAGLNRSTLRKGKGQKAKGKTIMGKTIESKRKDD